MCDCFLFVSYCQVGGWLSYWLVALVKLPRTVWIKISIVTKNILYDKHLSLSYIPVHNSWIYEPSRSSRTAALAWWWCSTAITPSLWLFSRAHNVPTRGYNWMVWTWTVATRIVWSANENTLPSSHYVAPLIGITCPYIHSCWLRYHLHEMNMITKRGVANFSPTLTPTPTPKKTVALE